ncbi:MAG: bifunctional oligoribonuclease/PAP phosphatase NrnA [Gemmatimonadota bacterium]
MSRRFAELLAVPESRRAGIVEIVRRARSARQVVLTTHVNADGDGAGSEAAIAAWLESVGVGVTIVNPTPFPPAFRFLLHRDDVVSELDDRGTPEAIRDADLVLVLDTSEANRIAPLVDLLDPERTMVLDHHPPGPTVVGRSGVQDPVAAATGELVYDVITVSEDPWPPASALGAYVAIVSDTGSFRFANTSPRAHAIAAELLDRGIDPEAVFQRLFAVAPPRRLQLLREALGRLEHDSDLGVAWIALPKAVTDRLGSTPDDYDGLIDHARSLEGTRVALLFREIAPDQTKLSLRSSDDTNVNQIARQFGGGGHVKASGASIELPLERAVEDVFNVVREAL